MSHDPYLLPCPFCGGLAQYKDDGLRVQCSNCGSRTSKMALPYDAAATVWNSRIAPESPAKEQPGEPTLTGELVVGNGHFHTGVKLSTVQRCIDRHITRTKQPGEQNAAPQEQLGPVDPETRQCGLATLAAAAPDVAAMVKRLERLAGHDSIRGEEIDGTSVSQSLSEAAALIEKLGQTQILYEELIYAVGNKHPGETRHQTALRYIRRAEAQSNETSQVANVPPPPERP